MYLVSVWVELFTVQDFHSEKASLNGAFSLSSFLSIHSIESGSFVRVYVWERSFPRAIFWSSHRIRFVSTHSAYCTYCLSLSFNLTAGEGWEQMQEFFGEYRNFHIVCNFTAGKNLAHCYSRYIFSYEIVTTIYIHWNVPHDTNVKHYYYYFRSHNVQWPNYWGPLDSGWCCWLAP